MSRYGPKARTAADRERDLIMFLGCATPDRIRAASPEELAGRYGVPLITAKYRHALALGKMG